MSSPLGVAMQSFASVLHSRYMPIATWVALEHSDEASRWRPYLEALPRSFPGWSPQRLAALEGTRAGELLVHRARAFDDDWGLLCDLIDDVRALPARELEWGLRIARSRCFDVAAAGGFALVPIAEMFDHATAFNAAWHYRSEKACFEVQTTRSVDAGEELHTRYGRYDNARWLAGYGFVLEHNDDDEVSLRFPSSDEVVHVGNRFDDRFRRAMAVALEAAGGDPHRMWRILDEVTRRSEARVAAQVVGVAGDEEWNRICRIVRAGEQAVLADVAGFVARADELVGRSPGERRAIADGIPADARGTDRLLRDFLLADG
jgi:hypothetical protein